MTGCASLGIDDLSAGVHAVHFERWQVALDDLGPGEFVEEKSLYAVRDPHPVLPHRNAYPQEKIYEDANGRLTLCEVLDVDFAKNVVLTQEREKENG